jgi:hypothetical protein
LLWSDHLEELPDYYIRLEDMEEKAEKNWKERRRDIKGRTELAAICCVFPEP